ncbi:Gfo/Idh/MocA family oxidoreductase [Tropicimonas sp. TH_r6]|uniref:Gfo/Idh/MocA family protein n=1 Tax=Tropicimonas sp. TH_r6 TaxID=3082085 RepID=UPI002954C7A7|nr:Gfo/Idh/MocA family oxidoreductase [Tropicimonas sp. TH_r6]MDV7141445.1 Gfo/Idh/MocA family oxidoreductase [Tropicimonas sp. TH_r6]
MKIGVIGLGLRLSKLAADFKEAAPGIHFTAVADPDDTRMEALEALGDSPVRYDTAEELLAADSYDLLMIGSVNSMHLEHLRLALESDVPFIFSEKPVVISVEETIELGRLIAEHDGMKRLMIGLVLRYSPLYRALRKAQADGQIGEVMSIEASEHIGPYHGSFFMRDWRRNCAEAGSFMLEKCCHDIDLYQGAVGVRPTRVASFGGRKKFVPSQRPATPPAYLGEMAPRWGGIDDPWSGKGDIIDYQTALVEYENGATMAFHTNLNVPDEFRRFCVIGVDGMAEGDFIRNTFKVTDSNTETVIQETDSIGTGDQKGHYGSDIAMCRDVMSFVKGDLAGLPLSVKDALEAGVTALAMDEAREQGRVVELAPVWDRLDAALAGKAAG